MSCLFDVCMKYEVVQMFGSQHISGNSFWMEFSFKVQITIHWYIFFYDFYTESCLVSLFFFLFSLANIKSIFKNIWELYTCKHSYIYTHNLSRQKKEEKKEEEEWDANSSPLSTQNVQSQLNICQHFSSWNLTSKLFKFKFQNGDCMGQKLQL